MTTIQLSFHSDLNASSEELWNWITSIEGIGKELHPLLKMTAPAGIRRLQDIEHRHAVLRRTFGTSES